jgi:GNAT superfamily N-acetyltransferase
MEIRPYQPTDLPGVRTIYGQDEFARPQLLKKYPRMGKYLADEAAYYYTEYEPESIFIAETEGSAVGALLGCVDTTRHKRMYRAHIRPMLVHRCLSGAYGWPGWAWAVIRTEIASRNVISPKVDLSLYPAHLHIGVLPEWRRQGIGTILMQAYAIYLRQREVPGYHLYASSYHPLGVAFYQKLGMAELGEFTWRHHNGRVWETVTERIFAQTL